MNQEQKDFILYRLIPFIMREQGNGFVMQMWRGSLLDNVSRQYYDHVPHKYTDTCQSVCCIGGSAQFLLDVPEDNYRLDSEGRDKSIAKLMGLTYAEAFGLFYIWRGVNMCELGTGWPLEYRERFDRAPTAERKAKVACDLLRAIVEKGPQILETL